MGTPLPSQPKAPTRGAWETTDAAEGRAVKQGHGVNRYVRLEASLL